MFWNRKSAHPPTEPTREAAPSAPKTSEELLAEAATSLAETLSAYSDAAYKAAGPKPDPELDSAYAKVRAAKTLVEDSGLAYALGRCVPEHVKYWPSWITHDDFEEYVGFAADAIEASSREEQGTYRTVEVATIDFTFKGTRYQLNLRDEGISSAPGDPYRFGEVELTANSKRVAKFGLIENLSLEYSTWTFSDVRALTVGPWMQDVLDMAAEIEASRGRQVNKFHDERAKAAAREIDLG